MNIISFPISSHNPTSRSSRPTLPPTIHFSRNDSFSDPFEAVFSANSEILRAQNKASMESDLNIAYNNHGKGKSERTITRQREIKIQKASVRMKMALALEEYNFYCACYRKIESAEEHTQEVIRVEEGDIDHSKWTPDIAKWIARDVKWDHMSLQHIRDKFAFKSYLTILDLPTKVVAAILRKACDGGLASNKQFKDHMQRLKEDNFFGGEYVFMCVSIKPNLNKETLQVLLACAVGIPMSAVRDQDYEGCVFVPAKEDDSCWAKVSEVDLLEAGTSTMAAAAPSISLPVSGFGRSELGNGGFEVNTTVTKETTALPAEAPAINEQAMKQKALAMPAANAASKSVLTGKKRKRSMN